MKNLVGVKKSTMQAILTFAVINLEKMVGRL